jgi:hypothetical protein
LSSEQEVTMNDNKTRSMLQRIPMILAVTAASYGLPMQAQATSVQAASSHAVSRPGTTRVAAPQPGLARQR